MDSVSFPVWREDKRVKTTGEGLGRDVRRGVEGLHEKKKDLSSFDGELIKVRKGPNYM